MPPTLFPLPNLLSGLLLLASFLKHGCWNSSWLGGWSPGEQQQLECNLCCWDGRAGASWSILGWKVQGRSISALLNYPLMHAVKQETLPVTHLLDVVWFVAFFMFSVAVFPKEQSLIYTVGCTITYRSAPPQKGVLHKSQNQTRQKSG